MINKDSLKNNSEYSFEQLLKRANELYAEAKIGSDVFYMAPEIRPEIRSDQVQSILAALVEYIDGRIEAAHDDLVDFVKGHE